MASLALWCLVLLFQCSTLLHQAAGEVVMVVTVHRHGSRTRLSKNGTTLQESASTLTPTGMRQLFQTGGELRARYFDQSTCALTSTCLAGSSWSSFTHADWYVQSSSLDRTLQSAQALLLGALPPTKAANGSLTAVESGLGRAGGYQPVPVYSLPLATDWIIRPFGEQKCATYLYKLEALYNTSFFQQYKAKYASLLSNLSSLFDTEVKLPDVWNYYDAYNVQYAYGANTPTGGPQLPHISNQTWTQLTEAAYWMEWQRYGNNSQGGTTCGGLLGDIVARMERGAQSYKAVPPSVAPGPRYVQYSAHYGTQLCLLSAINFTSLDTSANDPNKWIQGIPNYAAVLAFEVTAELSTGLRISAFLQNGPGAAYRRIVLPCTTSAVTDGSCSYADFKNFTAASVYPKVGGWCKACRNNTMTPCAAALYLESLNNTNSGNTSGSGSSSSTFNVSLSPSSSSPSSPPSSGGAKSAAWRMKYAFSALFVIVIALASVSVLV